MARTPLSLSFEAGTIERLARISQLLLLGGAAFCVGAMDTAREVAEEYEEGQQRELCSRTRWCPPQGVGPSRSRLWGALCRPLACPAKYSGDEAVKG